MKLVYLNFAEGPGIFGPAVDIPVKLKKRFDARDPTVEHEVATHELTDILGRFRENEKIDLSAELGSVIADCAKAAKIYIAFHGRAGSPDSAFTKVKTGSFETKAETVGKLLHQILPARLEEYKVALVMCYSARTADAEADHSLPLTLDQIRTSFAYRLARHLCVEQARSLFLTARTGKLSFDADGQTEVESERAIEFDRRIGGLTKSQKYLDAQRRWKELEARYKARDLPSVPFKLKIKFQKSGKLAITSNDRIAKNYFQLHKKARRLEREKMAETTFPLKYGKIVFVSEPDRVRIYRKYGDKQEIYVGPFV
ncbi:conserved hypothetical protein [Burkholderiales bacterium 8X]|nr:conserved hypothetical protein [Burkholderiales bacterium 8X]